MDPPLEIWNMKEQEMSVQDMLSANYWLGSLSEPQLNRKVYTKILSSQDNGGLVTQLQKRPEIGPTNRCV